MSLCIYFIVNIYRQDSDNSRSKLIVLNLFSSAIEKYIADRLFDLFNKLLFNGLSLLSLIKLNVMDEHGDIDDDMVIC